MHCNLRRVGPRCPREHCTEHLPRGPAHVGRSRASHPQSNTRLRSSEAEQPPLTDWHQVRKDRVLKELIEVAQRRRLPGVTPESLRSSFAVIESLVPGFYPNIDAMKALDWITLASDVSGVAQKVVLLKTHYPGLDLSVVLAANPKMLLLTTDEIEKNATQVKQLLATAKNRDALLQAVPSLLDPRNLISILVTVTKWYHLKRDPIEVLEADPDLVQRAQDNDVPLEPVYADENGEWMAPLLNYAEKRAPWQAYIDRTRYKQP